MTQEDISKLKVGSELIQQSTPDRQVIYRVTSIDGYKIVISPGKFYDISKKKTTYRDEQDWKKDSTILTPDLANKLTVK